MKLEETVEEVFINNYEATVLMNKVYFVERHNAKAVDLMLELPFEVLKMPFESIKIVTYKNDLVIDLNTRKEYNIDTKELFVNYFEKVQKENFADNTAKTHSIIRCGIMIKD